MMPTWENMHAPFVRYFKQQWINHYQPAYWAAFGCPPAVPTGDQCLEAWHQQLQNYIFAHEYMSIDHVVHHLYNE